MQAEKKKFKTMIILNSVGAGLSLLWAIMIMVSIIHFDNAVVPLLLSFFSILAAVGINLYLSIKILVSNWKIKWCQDNKLLWGILSLLVIGFIGIYVFIFVGLKHENDPINFEENKSEEHTKNPFKKELDSNKEL